MRSLHTLTILLATMIGAGCRGEKPPEGSQPPFDFASPHEIESLRSAYQQHYPDSQLGIVTGAIEHPNGVFVSVSGVDVTRMAVNQAVIFIDAQQRHLADGAVVRVLEDAVHVRVDQPPRGLRLPVTGDMMVRF